MATVDELKLIQAAFDGNKNEVKRLLDAKANVSAKGFFIDKNQRKFGEKNGDVTPFLAAAAGGHIDVMEYLIERGANPKDKLSDDTNAFFIAAVCGHANLVGTMLSPGIRLSEGTEKYSPEYKNAIGDNALHLAAMGGHKAVIDLLLSRTNLDVTARNNKPYSPRDLATQFGHHALAAYIATLERAAYAKKNRPKFQCEGDEKNIKKDLKKDDHDDDSQPGAPSHTPLK